jgi:dihydropteroate synthase
MFTLNCKGRLLVLDKPIVMGIINITPDSFYSASRQQNISSILKKAGQMLRDGATILDIGGQSTRPGSARVGAEEELKRVIAPIEALQKNFPEAFISIDTYHSLVAKHSVEAGASIINDISAGSLDNDLITTVAALDVPYVLMHMQGTPENMHEDPRYVNVTSEVLDFLLRKTNELKEAGISDIIIDPGFGFGKKIAHNFKLMRELPVFSILKHPLLLGISRKSFIYKTLGITADESLNGTTAMHMLGLEHGASILRVHDVKEAMQTISLWEASRS